MAGDRAADAWRQRRHRPHFEPSYLCALGALKGMKESSVRWVGPVFETPSVPEGLPRVSHRPVTAPLVTHALIS